MSTDNADAMDPIIQEVEQEIVRAEKLLEVAHAATRLSVSDEYIRQLIKAGKLKAFRLHPRGPWRITERALAAYLASVQEEPKPSKNSEPPAA